MREIQGGQGSLPPAPPTTLDWEMLAHHLRAGRDHFSPGPPPELTFFYLIPW